jgi:2-C-methyl-D-erythritol 4-phosphate cytidylyltransferase
MGSEIPKQFLLLRNKPIIFYTLEIFVALADEVVLVLPASQQEYFAQLCQQYGFEHKIKIALGGQERFHSVQNGLACIADHNNALVAVHDAVRPFTKSIIIEKAFEQASITGGCVVAVPSKDSIRKVTALGNVAVPRNEYYLVQTPQVFNLNMLREAYKQPFNCFTDDASVFESMGHKVAIIEGDYSNIKITTPEDLYFGEAILQMNS